MHFFGMQTFGDFSRYRGGRGSVWGGGGGRFCGSYYSRRGYGGYGYMVGVVVEVCMPRVEKHVLVMRIRDPKDNLDYRDKC